MDLAGLLFLEFLGLKGDCGMDFLQGPLCFGGCFLFKAGAPMGSLSSWSLQPTWFQGVRWVGVYPLGPPGLEIFQLVG